MSEGLGNAGQATPATANSASNSAKPTGGDAVTSTKSDQKQPDLSPNFKGTKHKVKIDGREMEVDYDELVSDYQARKSSMQRFNEAQKLANEAKEKLSKAEQFEKALEQGDIKWLEQKLGKAKAKEVMENYLIEQLEYEQLSPEAKRALELEEENKRLKQKQEDDEKSAKQKAKEDADRKAHAQLDNEIKEALKGLGRKPTPTMALRIVDEMIIAREGKKGEISAKDASVRAIKRIHGDIKEYLPGLSAEELRQVIPQEVIDALREDEIKRVTGEKSQVRRRAPDSTRAKSEDKPKSIDEWFDYKSKKLTRR